jgi:hypothetical protein
MRFACDSDLKCEQGREVFYIHGDNIQKRTSDHGENYSISAVG